MCVHIGGWEHMDGEVGILSKMTSVHHQGKNCFLKIGKKDGGYFMFITMEI